MPTRKPEQNGRGQFAISGEIRDSATGEPLPGLVVRVFDADVLSADDFLGQAKSTKTGRFTIRYRRAQFVKSILEAFLEGGPDLVVRVYDTSGDQLLHTTEVRKGASRFEHYALTVSAPRTPQTGVSIADVGKACGIKTSALDSLKASGVTHVKDLFSVRGRKAIRALRLDEPDQKRLLATARITALSGDLSLSKKLAEKGIDSISMLGRMSTTRLETMLGATHSVDKEAIERLRSQAVAVKMLVAGLSIDKTKLANAADRWPGSAGPPGGLDLEIVDEIPEEELCAECDEWRTVFSPFAYLLHLLDFIMDNWGVASQTLEGILFQPIAEVDCESGSDPTRQIWLAIEILEKYLTSMGTPLPEADWRMEFDAVCERLLQVADLSDDSVTHDSATLSLSSLDAVVDQVRAAEHARIDEANQPPDAPGADADDDEEEQHAAAVSVIEAERERLEAEFESKIATIISPVLVAYREALIDATGEAVEHLENRLFIDLRNGPCHITARATQLIQSLQAFILAIRTGEISEVKTTGHLEPLIGDVTFGHFDEKTWHWLRTYATWSSAMYVQVYPENVLSPPTLRRRMTPGFQAAANSLMSTPTPQSIEESVSAYRAYLRSTRRLTLIAAHVTGARLFLFARVRTDLWMDVMDIQTGVWKGWREVDGWDASLTPQRVHDESEEDDDVAFIIECTHDTKPNEMQYVRVSGNGSCDGRISEEEQDAIGTGIDQEWECSIIDQAGPPREIRAIAITDGDVSWTVSPELDGAKGDARQAVVATLRDYDAKTYIVAGVGSTTATTAIMWCGIDFDSRSAYGDWGIVSVSNTAIAKQVAKLRATGGYPDVQRPVPEILTSQTFEESYLHLHLLSAWAWNRAGVFASAHNSYRKLYDPFASDQKRTQFPFDDFFPGATKLREDWLSDPLDPHAIAHQRREVYLRHVILMMVKNLLEWADHEFALANPESLNRARELYLLAEKILASPDLESPCGQLLRAIEIEIVEQFALESWKVKIASCIAGLRNVNGRSILRQAMGRIQQIAADTSAPEDAYEKIKSVVDRALREESGRRTGSTLGVIRASVRAKGEAVEDAFLSHALDEADIIDDLPKWWKGDHESFSAAPFLLCIPTNPLLDALRSRIEANLRKLRTCRTIDGEYQPPATTPAGGTDGWIPDDLSQIATATDTLTIPPRYRYSYLVERARQQAGLAQQLAAAMLAAVEKRDQAAYDMLIAENAVEVAGETVSLKGLLTTEARHAKDVAEVQRRKVGKECEHWVELTTGNTMGLSAAEITGMGLMAASGGIQALCAGPVAALAGIGTVQTAAGLGLDTTVVAAPFGIPVTGTGLLATGAALAAGGQQIAGALGTFGNLSLTLAGFQRRLEDWMFQRALSEYDRVIADLQVTLAVDKADIADKEKHISGIQHRHAKEVLEFLRNKDTNRELYEWMVDVLRQNYWTVMQTAATTARLAQAALEFERQRTLSYVQGDYWTIDEGSLTENQKALGLLGAEKLLTDLTSLDGFKQNTDERCLQLSKTISLARMAPADDFVKFKRTGRIECQTLMDWFDWDFPGHYMRLIKSVKVTVVALVPPAEGIHATLTNDGWSSVVVNENGNFIEKRALRTFPETVALDSPYNDAGLFVLDYNDPMLLPFESLGVQTKWTFELPRGTNRFNFDTIVDVLLTIDYTARHDDKYKGQVIQRLGNELSTQMVISLRTNYPDEWYRLNNPIKSDQYQHGSLMVPQHALPPNMKAESLYVEHVTAIVVPRGGETAVPGEVCAAIQDKIRLQKTSMTDAGVATDIDMVLHLDELGDEQTTLAFSTWRAAPNSFTLENDTSPVGDWEILADSSLYDGTHGQRHIDKISDIVLAITVHGEVAWE